MPTDQSGQTALHKAAMRGDTRAIQEGLEAGVNPDHVDTNGQTALFMAVLYCRPIAVELLLKAGTDLEIRDNWGNTALWRATFNYEGLDSGADARVIELLMDAGADPYAENDYGVSPVSLARDIANYDTEKFYSHLP